MKHAGIIVCALFTLAGCVRGELGLDDLSAVDTPAYRANKVLFLDPDPNVANKDKAPLKYDFEIADRNSATAVGVRRSVRNRDPISIVVSRAYLPASVFSCIPRETDGLFRSKAANPEATRDIAVLLDVSTAAGSQEFIAVWYQRGVRPDELLNFENLLVYATEAWDNRYPPYFRLRLMDVSAERNTAVRAMLESGQATSGTVLSLAGVAGAAPILGLAASAAQQVLANEKNIALVDFTFQLYGEQLLADSGGVPLGILQTGGTVVTAPPCEKKNDWWESRLDYNFRLNRIEKDGVAQDMPFVFATIIGTDLAVPQIVKERSAAILTRLTDPKATQAEIDSALADAGRLKDALSALSERERFLSAPSRESFKAFIQRVLDFEGRIDAQEQRFYLNSLYQTTGRSFGTVKEYMDWLEKCPAAKMNVETRKFDATKDIKDKDAKPCWPDLFG